MKRLILIILIFVFNIKNVLSDSLYDALKVTYKNNKELNAERENVNIAEEDLKISKGNYLPTGTITGSKSQQDTNKLTNQGGGDAIINDVNPLNTTIKLEQTLIDFGRNAELKKSQLGLNLSKEKLKKKEQEIFYKAIEAHSNLVASIEKIEINDKNLNLLIRQVENDKTRLEIGQITLSDLSQSESSLAGAQAKNIKAINDLTTSKLNYENIIGKIDNMDNLIKSLNPISPLPKSLNEAIELSNNNNPDVIIAKIEYDQSVKDLKISKSDLAPTATLSIERSNTEDLSSTVDEKEQACSFSSTVELKSSVFDLSIDKVAVGARSDLDIFKSFTDWSYSIFAIMTSGLLLFDNSIASFKDLGNGDIGFNDLIKLSILSILPIIFS